MELSKQQLLDSIHPGMRLTKGLLKRVYGYGVTDPTFPDKAIAALEAAGCSKTRQYYDDWVNEYETARDIELKSIARRYHLEHEKEWRRIKEGDEKRTMYAEAELLAQKRRLLMQKSQILTGS